MSRAGKFDEAVALRKATDALEESSNLVRALVDAPVGTDKAAKLRGAYTKLEYAVFLLKLVTNDESHLEYDRSMVRQDRTSLLKKALEAIGNSQRAILADPMAALRDARAARDSVRTVLHAVNLEIRRGMRKK